MMFQSDCLVIVDHISRTLLLMPHISTSVHQCPNLLKMTYSLFVDLMGSSCYKGLKSKYQSCEGPMQLKLIGGSACGNGPCPAVYETGNKTIVVQGFTVNPAKAGITLPPGEMMVEIPRDVLERALGL
jgi:hypothetical protein